ncbi:hypothetical protein MHB50_11395 [Siminovitchia sp. FSL H7-0308]|uniref:hypothetical protein n=1 Tax=Siminovitchia sp. FSL H7-0308 TaxID=2921432 RepID=UPI00097D3ED0|nr:hypothetical protein BLX87_05510 [Bacillus sp. VT-16-64]
MLLANENTYRSLSTFQSVEEMDEAIKAHRSAHKLSETERAVLDVISQYACKYVGVCYLSKTNIGKAVGKVRRTVIRVCQRLEALGIIKQYETKRDGGDRRQSTNVIVILAANDSPVSQKESRVSFSNRPTSGSMAEKGTQNGYTFEEDEMRIMRNYKAQVTPDMSRQEAPSKNINNNTYKETYISADEIIKRGLKHAIPTPIYNALAPFFGGQELYDTYGILLRAKASVDRSITLETHGQAYIDAFMNVVRLYKAGKVRSLSGLLYRTWQAVTSTIKRRVSVDKHPVLYDWLA